WLNAVGLLVRAGVAASSHNEIDALGDLREAARRFDAVHMDLYAAVARRRQGELVGGDEGVSLIAGADAFMATQQIKDPERMADMIAPGFRDLSVRRLPARRNPC